ncbi:MAG: peptidyl-prolyl cis-trans isomerase [Roseivirga sp.]|nr:peptidyl-prolyl cis-trans isomerase [Roseivirga sp.]
MGYDKGNKDQEAGLVARAGNSLLYKRDITGLVSPDLTSQDSAEVVAKFVENWIKEELLIQEAAGNIQLDLSDIERKVAKYRFILISHEYQKQKIEQELNREVSDQEIQEYYELNRDNFILKQNIVRGRYVKISQEAPKKSDVKRWIKSDRPQDIESLKSYCFQFADNYSVEDSTWLKFDDVIKNSPLNTIENKIQFLRRNRYVEESDSAYLYLFKINEYKISEEASPLEFVRNDIEKIIINKRKVALTKSLENDIYERAKENEDFEIYE